MRRRRRPRTGREGVIMSSDAGISSNGAQARQRCPPLPPATASIATASRDADTPSGSWLRLRHPRNGQRATSCITTSSRSGSAATVHGSYWDAIRCRVVLIFSCGSSWRGGGEARVDLQTHGSEVQKQHIVRCAIITDGQVLNMYASSLLHTHTIRAPLTWLALFFLALAIRRASNSSGVAAPYFLASDVVDSAFRHTSPSRTTPAPATHVTMEAQIARMC